MTERTTPDMSSDGPPTAPLSPRLARARMAVSRHAAALFWERGVAATSGDDIAEAAGVSPRSVWRYFRSKESCVEPLLAASVYRFMAALDRWPLGSSLEEFLLAELSDDPSSPEQIEDDLSALRMIALAATEPAIRSAWLMVCDEAERQLVTVVARRLDLTTTNPQVRVCAAAATAAVRVVNEDISIAALRDHQQFTAAEVIHRLADAVRASTAETGFAGPARS
ncbi:TetR family transcriptional regulator [Promicromonospora sp. AC04]|nr:TetR family transcriptional regulator [Promicromonospora sp. AC04]